MRAQHGLPALAVAEVRAFVGDGARTLLRRALAAVLPAEPAAAERVVSAAFAVYVEHHTAQCTQLVREYPGVATALAALRARGHALAVVTNKPERFVGPLLDHLGLRPLFGAVVGGDTLPQHKPDPAPLRCALQRLGADPAGGGTMVGDGVQDLRAGKAAGLRTIACLYGYGDRDALAREGADACWQAFGIATPCAAPPPRSR